MSENHTQTTVQPPTLVKIIGSCGGCWIAVLVALFFILLCILPIYGGSMALIYQLPYSSKDISSLEKICGVIVFILGSTGFIFIIAYGFSRGPKIFAKLLAMIGDMFRWMTK